MRLLFLFLFSFLFVNAQAKEAYVHPFLTSSFKLTPKINVISGEHVEEELDLVVAGSEPLSLRRFYSHLAPKDPRFGLWLINPESQCVANFEFEGLEKFASIGNQDGSIFFLNQRTPHGFKAQASGIKGYCHTQPNGQNHPLNCQCNFTTTPR